MADVKKMQEILYRDSPYLVTAYSSIGEAVRSDKFACFVPQPNPGGIWIEQYGVYNYIHAKPASEAGNCDSATAGGSLSQAVEAATSSSSSSGVSTPVLVGLGVVVVAALVRGRHRDGPPTLHGRRARVSGA